MTTPTSPTIRADCTDQQLNEAVAIHCVGWKPGMYRGDWWKDGNVTLSFDGPPCEKFATDANAVLPLLEKSGHDWDIHNSARIKSGVEVPVYIVRMIIQGNYVYGQAPTFCRAACYCLLKANGVTVQE